MSNINKQALREAAEKALNARARLELIESIFDDDGDITTEAQEDTKICTSFNDLTNPATVLALLDELEGKEKQRAAANKVVVQQDIELQELRLRIAELEARELVVNLPAYVDGRTLGYGEVNHMLDLCADAIEKAGHAAGIITKVGE